MHMLDLWWREGTGSLCVQSDMQELIETRMADEIARDREKSAGVAVSASRQRDTSASKAVNETSSLTNKKLFSLRWS